MSRTSVHQDTAARTAPAVADSLLRTKLFIPLVRARLVGRPRLTEKLNAGLDRALILVSAPAGYGKTTLVSGWLRETGIPCAWLSLDEDDNEPRRFLQYLVAAIRMIVPTIPGDAVQMLSGTAAASVEALLTVIINEISLQGRPLVLALDDLHAIHARPVLDALHFLIEHIPPELHVMLLSRSDLPLPLARLRARGQIQDLRAGDLRFDPGEVAAFLKDVMGLALTADDIASIEARTEGWIAGLQLAALSLQGSHDAHSFVEEFASRQDYMVDYLVEEVLNAQPDDIRTFLLQTSGLGRMCGELCDAVLEPAPGVPPAGRDTLQALHERNLFVMPLDDELRWYRYHHLFADVLHKHLRHLDSALAARLDARAAAWYEANGHLAEAIHHSIAAGNHAHAVRLIEQNGCSLLIRGEVLTLEAWLDAVEGSAPDQPWLPIYRGWITTLTGNADRIEEHLRRAEDRIAALPPRPDMATMKGAIAAARAQSFNVRGQPAAAAEFARQAVAQLTDTDATTCSLRVVAIALLGDASMIRGDLDVAWEAYNEANRFVKSAGDVHLSIVLNSNLANILMQQGQLRRAAAIHRETLALAALPGGGLASIGGRTCIELGQICYEWNQLEEAAAHLERGLDLCRPWGNRDMLAIGLSLRAQLVAVRGDADQVRKDMQSAHQLVRDYRLASTHSNWVKAALARLWLAQGEISRVVDLVEESGITDAAEVPYPREPELIMLIRLRLAQGDPDAALRSIRQLIPRAEASRRHASLIELQVLQALAAQAQGDLDAALVCLGAALRLARPEGYVRSFLDEGGGLARLLYQAKTRGVEAGYAAELLEAARGGAGTKVPPAQWLPQPLTARELEVLRLIDRGCSNQDVAAELYISLATVKRHISNIYTKLDASSRTQALSRSRELGMLD
jgi:LuxR family maltose regulon positive regulatory protein